MSEEEVELTTEQVKYWFSEDQDETNVAKNNARFDAWLAKHTRQAIVQAFYDYADFNDAVADKPPCSLTDKEYTEIKAIADGARHYANNGVVLVEDNNKHVHVRRSSFGDAYCKSCGKDLE